MPTIDLSFRITGTTIPADHGYSLYSALSHLISDIHKSKSHDTPDIGIHPISGLLAGDRRLLINEKSRLQLRINSNNIADFLPLSGKHVTIDGCKLMIYVPEVFMLTPSPRLHSHLVIIKGFTEPDTFLDAVKRQLEKLSISDTPNLLLRKNQTSIKGKSLSPDKSPFVRRTIRISDKEIAGYALEVANLTAEESIRLQEYGVGGRRHFGCGIFVSAGQ
jgi:CRISPR-associated protein Cas6